MYKTLIFSYYVDANEERNKEIIHCFQKNLQVGFDCIIVFSEVDINAIYKNIDNDILENFCHYCKNKVVLLMLNLIAP